MGGSVNVLVRFSNDEKKAFRMHTSQLKDFENPLFLDENKFKSHIIENYFKGEPQKKEEHKDYYSLKTYFVPYAYGALFFDLKEKKIFSCNGYNGFLSFSCLGIFSKLSKLICEARENNEHLYEQAEIIYSFDFEKKETIELENANIFEEPSYSHSDFYMINHALKNNWNVTINEKTINHNKDFIQLMNVILNKNIIAETTKPSDSFDWAVTEEFSSEYIDYIDIEPQGWEFFQGDNSYESLNELFDYVKSNSILNESETILWTDYINELKRNEDEYEN